MTSPPSPENHPINTPPIQINIPYNKQLIFSIKTLRTIYLKSSHAFVFLAIPLDHTHLPNNFSIKLSPNSPNSLLNSKLSSSLQTNSQLFCLCTQPSFSYNLVGISTIMPIKTISPLSLLTFFIHLTTLHSLPHILSTPPFTIYTFNPLQPLYSLPSYLLRWQMASDSVILNTIQFPPILSPLFAQFI
jgi:hypothetical protein